MKLWLDDQINDPETPDRWTPPGWHGTTSALEACRLINRGVVTEISLDHDLGAGKLSGYIVARFIEKRAFLGVMDPPLVHIHSANPVGRRNMEAAINAANHHWYKNQQILG